MAGRLPGRLPEADCGSGPEGCRGRPREWIRRRVCRLTSGRTACGAKIDSQAAVGIPLSLSLSNSARFAPDPADTDQVYLSGLFYYREPTPVGARQSWSLLMGEQD